MKTKVLQNFYVTPVLDLSYGDCGKGSVAHNMIKNGNFTHVMRVSGGSNAGHTIHVDGKKIVTHLVPCGILHGLPSIIGNGCVLNENKFFEEVEYLKNLGYDTSLIKIARNCHIVTDYHIDYEEKEWRIGTTKQGIGPAYAAKYERNGLTADCLPKLAPYIIDMYDYLYYGDQFSSPKNILVEGAQGHWLDIDYGEYPYVTSSHPTIGGVLKNYMSPHSIHKIVGVFKAYDTYVGAKNFQPEESEYTHIFEKIVELGEEFGATTGRKRQINWLNLDKIIEAAILNGCTNFVINKLDILEKVNSIYPDSWKLIYQGELLTFKDDKIKGSAKNQWKNFIEEIVTKHTQIFNWKLKYDGTSFTFRSSPNEEIKIKGPI
jgi:adenylosuccinate synthase